MAKEEDIVLVEHRIAKVKEAILIGMTNKEILDRYGLEKIDNKPNKYYLGVSTRQVDNYIIKAKEQIRNSSSFDKSAELGRAIERYDMLFKTSMASNKIKEAISINKELSTLLGLIQKPDEDAKIIPKNIDPMNEEQIQAALKFAETLQND